MINIEKSKNFIDYKEFQEMIEEQVQEKIINNPSWHHELERIQKEGWLGETWARGKNGLKIKRKK